jgi:hypothetical protein
MALSYKVATIFSASNYCWDGDTHAGIVHVITGPSYEKRTFPPLPIVARHNVLFVSSDAFRIKRAVPKCVSVRGSRTSDERIGEKISGTGLKRIVTIRPRRPFSQRVEPPKRRFPEMISPRRRIGRV